MPRRANLRPDEPGRQKVLAAGRDLFGERGYHATSIAEIGIRADIAKSVLYHYFGSKAGLYQAIVEAETGALLDRVAAAVRAHPDVPRLRAGLDAYLSFLAERPAAWRLLLRDPPADPALIAVHERLTRQRSARLADILAQPDNTADKQSHIELVATAIRTFAAWWYDHPHIPQRQITEAIIDVAQAGSRRIHEPSHQLAEEHR